MGLHSLLGLPLTVNGESLPAYLNRTTRPAPKPAPDPVEAELAKWRAERDEQATYDRHAIAETIRRKRDAAAAMNYSDNPIQNAEQRFHQSRKWDRVANQLNGDHYDE